MLSFILTSLLPANVLTEAVNVGNVSIQYQYESLTNNDVLTTLNKCFTLRYTMTTLYCARSCKPPCRAFGYSEETGRCDHCSLAWNKDLQSDVAHNPAPGLLYYAGNIIYW